MRSLERKKKTLGSVCVCVSNLCFFMCLLLLVKTRLVGPGKSGIRYLLQLSSSVSRSIV